MRHHSINTEMYYPVGSNMKENLVTIRSYVASIVEEYPTQPLQLWVRGSSGAIIGGVIAAMLPDRDINIFHVKKSGESSHSSSPVLPGHINIIVDDFMCSGSTLNSIYTEMRLRNTVPDTLVISGTVTLDKLEFNVGLYICYDVTERPENLKDE